MQRAELAARRLAELLPPEALMLDIGAGAQDASAFFRGLGHKVQTLDFDPSADFRGAYQDFVCPAENYDAIWASHVLEHQTDPHTFLQKNRKELKPGGLLCLTVPPLKHRIVGGHLTLWNAGLLLYNLVRAGFDCADARVASYGYNISVIVTKPETPITLPALQHDHGDLDTLAPFFPAGLVQGDSFDGQIAELNWAS